jgi:uncharacterized protein
MSSQCRTTVLPEHGLTLLKSSILVSSLVIGQGGVAEPLRSAPEWQPDPPKYEFELTKDLDVQMDDGVHLRVDVYSPVDPMTRKRAPGKFPVLLEQTPYGKDRLAAGSANTAKYFVSRGYIFAVADLRGFGNSQGQAAWFGSRMGRDGAELADWAAHLGSANGKVGLIVALHVNLDKMLELGRETFTA